MKETTNDLYLHWESFSPISRKRWTLKSLISRVYMICSNQSLLEKELKHLKNIFHKKNGYPLWMINQVMERVKETTNIENVSTNQLDILEANNDKLHPLILPYAELKGNNIIKSMNNNIQRILPNNVKTRTTYTGRKLRTKFQIKDLSKNQHEHDLIYYSKCPKPNCNEDYLGEAGRRIIERTADTGNMYHGNKYKRKISKALYIKQYRPSLNAQEHSVKLKLFN